VGECDYSFPLLFGVIFHGVLSFENNCFLFHFGGFRRISFVFPLAILLFFVILLLCDVGECDYSFPLLFGVIFHGVLSFGAENNCFIFHFGGFHRISFVFPLAIQSFFVILLLCDVGECDYSFPLLFGVIFHGVLSFENNCFLFHFGGFRRISFVFPLAILLFFVILLLCDGGDCDYSFPLLFGVIFHGVLSFGNQNNCFIF
jgi:uncharacterized membrane protein YoaT (DUF817 family)